MARAPRRGAAKTRLEPLLGPDGCARLQTELIRHTAGWVAGAAARTKVAFTPADARAEVAALVPAGVELLAQSPGDLGTRMAEATGRATGPVAVVGTDAPLLGPAQLRRAERALAEGHDACIVPATDGGYVLLALARHAPAAFALPPAAWGGPDVCELTQSALAAAGLRCAVLAAVPDLDVPADAIALLADPRCPSAITTVLSAARG